jgi:hypothetical protein
MNENPELGTLKPSRNGSLIERVPIGLGVGRCVYARHWV